MTTWTEHSMQLALTASGNLFDSSSYAVVPNVNSYTFAGSNEIDLLCLSRARVFHEVEIKVSAADLRADAKKDRAHSGPFTRFVWFAVPASLGALALATVPEQYGVVTITSITYPVIPGHRDEEFIRIHTSILRRPKKRAEAKTPTPKEVEQFLRLGVQRMWLRRRAA